MTAWQLIRTHLAADSSVTSLATGGIYPVRGKQGEPRPQIIGRQTGSGQERGISSVLAWMDSTLDIGCVATSYDGAVALYEAARVSLQSMQGLTISGKQVGSIAIENMREIDFPDEQVSLYAVMFTVQLKHQI